MACNLIPDVSGTVDFLTTTGALVKVLVESNSATVHIVAATFNSAPTPVSGGTVTFVAVAGTNLLSLALAGSDPAEDYQVKEDCGTGSSNVMGTGSLLDGPTRGFRIHAV